MHEHHVHLQIRYPDVAGLNRWLPLVKWLLAVPHYVVLAFLWLGAMLAVLAAWVAILFTGRYPRALFRYVEGVLRWQNRVLAYAGLLVSDRYPPVPAGGVSAVAAWVAKAASPDGRRRRPRPRRGRHPGGGPRPMTPARLTPAAIAFRAVHAVIALGFLTAILDVWWCALSNRRNRWLRPAVAALLTEGAVVTANHGDCPLGPVQARVGDPVPLFELVLAPAAARRAVPALGLIAAAGIALLGRRRQQLHGAARSGG